METIPARFQSSYHVVPRQTGKLTSLSVCKENVGSSSIHFVSLRSKNVGIIDTVL